MFSKTDIGNFDLNKALNDLVQAGLRDPNILLKYSQNPPPEYGANGKLLVSLASNAVARNKVAANTLKPVPSTTVTDQVENKLAAATHPQGIMGLSNQTRPTQSGIATPQEQPSPQAMNTGVATLPVDEGMYDEQNYAGGGIVSFVKGGPSKDPYSIDNYQMEEPIIPTADDLYMQTRELKSKFVPADYYTTEEATIRKEGGEDIAEAKKMGQADVLFALAEGFQTPGGFIRGATAAGTKARPAVADMNKNVLAAKRLERESLNNLRKAQYAESIGDYKTAAEYQKLHEQLNFEAKKTNATLGAQLSKAKATLAANNVYKEYDVNTKALKAANDMFASSFPAGSEATVFRNNPGFETFVRNFYRNHAEGYIREKKMPTIPNEDQLLTMFNNYKAKMSKPSSKADDAKVKETKEKTSSILSGAESPLAITRPAKMDTWLSRYGSSRIRNKNTPEELNTDWDSAGPHEPEDEDSQ